MMNNRVTKAIESKTATEERILIVTPRPQDVAAIGGALAGAGLQPVICENLAECCRQILQGVGVVLLVEEALDAAQMPALLKVLEQQPPWSDLPVLLLASRREADQGDLGLIEQLNGAVTVLEQPMRGRNLLATVEMALRVRRHQYQFRDLMAERERNAREEKARREELEALLDNIPAGVGVWMARDSEGRSIIGNKACYEMLRLPPGTDLSKTGPHADQLRHYQILVNGKHVPASELPLQRVCRTSQPLWGEELEFRFDDGTTCCVLGNVVPLFKEDGSPRGALGIFIDITARKRAEEELRRRELQYRALAEHSLDGIVRHDRQTRHLYANETVLRALGRPREAVIGKRLDEVGLPEELVRKWSEGNERVFQTGRPEIQMFIFPLPEGPHHFHKVFAPEFGPDGSVESVLHIGRDVDELVKAQEELERTKQEWERTFDSVPDLVMILDDQHRIKRVNRAMAERLGLTPGQCIGRICYECVHGTSCPPAYCPHSSTLADGRLHACEVHEERLQGDFLVSTTPLLDEQGRMVGAVHVARDITARRQAEAALRQSEERLKLVIQAARLGTWDWDLTTGKIFGSARCLALFGLAPEETPTTYERFLEAIHPEDRARIDSGVRAALERREDYDVEMRTTWPDGSLHWVASRGRGYYDGSGRPVRMNGVAMDITSRKEAEEALRQSEEKFRVVAENTQAVFGIVQDRRFVYVNPYLTQLSGYSMAEILAMDISQLVHPSFREVVVARARARQRGEPVPAHYEFLMVTKSGEERWIDLSAGTIQYRGRVAVIGTGYDITERKRAEEALRRSEDRFREAFAHAPVGMVLTDLAGRFLHINPEYCRITGYSEAELLRPDRNFKQLTHPDDLAANLEALNRMVAGETPAFFVEKRYIRKDASIVWVRVSASLRRDAAGRPFQIIGLIEDVTARKQAEEALRQAKEQLARANEELEQRVRERTAKLQEVVGELEHFSYSITHDMRAPLRAMRGFAGLLLQPPITLSEEMRADFLQRIGASAERMDRLITDALDYNKAVRQELALAPVDVDALLRSMLASYPDFQPPRAQIRIEGALPKVLGNEAALTQCLSNLLGNAVKFVQPGQVPRVRVWAEEMSNVEGRVSNPEEVRSAECGVRNGGAGAQAAEAGQRATGKRVRLWFEDNGIGIAPEDQRTIFDMFQRLNPEYEGTGIGLALVRKVMERMGGKVGVESEPGKGSRFWLDLKGCPAR